MQKNGNKKELHKCINDFWHKTHFFLCYNAYFFLVNNIKSVSVIYPTKKILEKILDIFFDLSMYWFQQKIKEATAKNKMLHQVFSPQRNFPSHKMLLQSGPKNMYKLAH